jgi:signal peptidase I
MSGRRRADVTDADGQREIPGRRKGRSPVREPMSGRRRRNRRRYYAYEIISTLIYVAFVYLLCTGVVRFVGQKTVVEGSSMSPSLEDGDNLIVDKLSYRFGDPGRYDIIVFRYQYKEDSYYIKRVIGLPGETVQIVDGYIYINGELLSEEFGNAVMENAGRASQEVVLGPDEYFVLGDNRNLSSDSRDPLVANVQREQIVGKAFICIYPFDRFGFLRHP